MPFLSLQWPKSYRTRWLPAFSLSYGHEVHLVVKEHRGLTNSGALPTHHHSFRGYAAIFFCLEGSF